MDASAIDLLEAGCKGCKPWAASKGKTAEKDETQERSENKKRKVNTADDQYPHD